MNKRTIVEKARQDKMRRDFKTWAGDRCVWEYTDAGQVAAT